MSAVRYPLVQERLIEAAGTALAARRAGLGAAIGIFHVTVGAPEHPLGRLFDLGQMHPDVRRLGAPYGACAHTDGPALPVRPVVGIAALFRIQGVRQFVPHGVLDLVLSDQIEQEGGEFDALLPDATQPQRLLAVVPTELPSLQGETTPFPQEHVGVGREFCLGHDLYNEDQGRQ